MGCIGISGYRTAHIVRAVCEGVNDTFDTFDKLYVGSIVLSILHRQ